MAWQMAIYDRLRAGLPNTRVFLEGVPENSPVPSDPTGMIKPFVILWFGQLTRSINAENRDVVGLCDDPEDNTENGKQGNISIQSVAPTGLSLLQLEDAIRVLMTSFSPAGQAPLSEDGTTTIRDPMPIGIGDQIRFYKQLFFRGDFYDTVSGASPGMSVAALRTHCPEGHPYDEYNTVVNGDGKRRCRTCINARARARRADSPVR